MAPDFDEVRSDVAEWSEKTLKTVQALDAPYARSVVEAFAEPELVVRVRPHPEAQDEFICGSCFVVRHHTTWAGEKNGVPICRDCAAD